MGATCTCNAPLLGGRTLDPVRESARARVRGNTDVFLSNALVTAEWGGGWSQGPPLDPGVSPVHLESRWCRWSPAGTDDCVF